MLTSTYSTQEKMNEVPVESEGLVDQGGRVMKTMKEASPPNFTEKLLKLRGRKKGRFHFSLQSTVSE